MVNFKTNVLIKNIIWKDLINSDNIAILELVKNSFDAWSEEVFVRFKNLASAPELLILDYWDWMSREDIEDKWLNIAYSEKKIKKNKNWRLMAGAKWVWRFSCDRLGERLDLYTKKINSDKVMHLWINWSDFEVNNIDLKIEDVNISLTELEVDDFERKFWLNNFQQGTLINISNLRNDWTYLKTQKKEWELSKFKSLKKDLEKLINPNEAFSNKPFLINFEIDDSIDKDKDGKKISWKIENTIFRELWFRTTYIESELTDNWRKVITTLYDKWRTILSFEEEVKGDFDFNWSIRITLYYMSPYSKIYFAKKTWEKIIDFWSIFVFINWFRIPPYWDSWNDWLWLELRKWQWYSRFLWSREILWRVEVTDNNNDFQIVSSREGIVNDKKFDALKNFSLVTHRRLEKYVSDGINWDSAFWNTSEERKETIRKFEELSLNMSIEELYKHEQYSRSDKDVLENSRKVIFQILNVEWSWIIKDFVIDDKIVNSLIDENQDEKNEFLKNLKKYWRTDQQVKIINDLINANNKLDVLVKENYQKDKKIETLIEDSIKDKEIIQEQEKEIIETKQDIKVQKNIIDNLQEVNKKFEKEVLFLSSSASQDNIDLINLFHQIGINTDIISKKLSRAIALLNTDYKKSDLLEILGWIDYEVNKIATVSGFATKINFNESCEKVDKDIVNFFEEYITKVAGAIYRSSVDIAVTTNNCSKKIFFMPIEMTILIDNLLNNSMKHNSSKIIFTFEQKREYLSLLISNNWDFFDKKITDINHIFDLAFTTTRWSWLWLYHINKIVKQQWWEITAYNNSDKGVTFSINIY